MTDPPQSQGDEEQLEAARQVNAMQAQLRKDVDSWSKARSEAATEHSAEPSAPSTRKPSSLYAVGARKSRSAPRVAKESALPKKPFSMFYDGITSAEYIQYMLDRGSR